MGRYYSGDIKGKFWFAVQSSTAADRFGVSYSHVKYYYDKEDLDSVEKEIANIEGKLGDKKKILDDFFADVSGYSDYEIEALGVSQDELKEYADLGLGIKIRDCIIKTGYCNFEAEL